MNILCYCEANSKTGFGHFTRVKIFISLIKKNIHKQILRYFQKIGLKQKIFLKQK